MLEEVIAAYPADESRIYLTGYSMGGQGAWCALSRSPERFAAAAPVASGSDPRSICTVTDVAIRTYRSDCTNGLCSWRGVLQ